MQMSIKRVLCALAIGCAATSGAEAADLGGWSPRPEPEPYYATPLDTARWTGAYVGIAGGYGFGDNDVVRGNTPILSLDQSGGLGWVYGGYNWQFGNFVTGLEADVGIGNLDGSDISGSRSADAELNALGSIRGRAGVLLSPVFLVYGTAGFAWNNMDITARGDTDSETFTGYTVGFGSELNMSGPWSLRLEYLYTDLGEEDITRRGVTDTYDLDYHTIRAGLSYKF